MSACAARTRVAVEQPRGQRAGEPGGPEHGTTLGATDPPAQLCSASAAAICVAALGDLLVGQRPVAAPGRRAAAPATRCPRRAARRRGRRRTPRRRRAAAAGVPDHREHLGGGDVLGDDHREVLAHLGEARQVAVERGRRLRHGVEVELERGHRVARGPTSRRPAGGSRRASRPARRRRGSSAAGPGAGTARRPGSTSQSAPSASSRPASTPLAAKKSAGRRAAARARSRARDRAGQQRADVVGLARQLRRLGRQVHRAGLEQPHAPAPRARLRRATSSSEPSSVVRSCDCSLDIGLSSADRAPAAGRSAPSRSRSRASGPAKLQPTISCSALGGQRVGGAPAQALAVRSAGPTRRGGRAASPAASRARRAARPPRSGRPRG